MNKSVIRHTGPFYNKYFTKIQDYNILVIEKTNEVVDRHPLNPALS